MRHIVRTQQNQAKPNGTGNPAGKAGAVKQNGGKAPVSRSKKKKTEDLIAWVTLLLLVLCSIIGFNRSKTDLTVFQEKLWPEAAGFENLGYETMLATSENGATIGCITTGTFNGFGGPLKVAVAVDPEGVIENIVVVEHRESPSWYDRVMESELLIALKGKSYQDPIQLGKDMDGITGATYTTRAITNATKEATLEAAKDILNHDVRPYVVQKRIKTGVPEIALTSLLIIATICVFKVPKRHQKTTKWILMILSASLIGFTFNHPLTLVDVNKLIMGYWPDVYNQLYWYLLIFGIIVIFITTGKNTYCKYVCPFGAVQECIGAITSAQTTVSRQYNRLFNWTRRIVVLLAIMIALIYRNPGMSSYEVYGTIFNLLGTNFELFFLFFVLGFALFIKRPWCNYLCPIPVIEHYARFIYKKLKAPFEQADKLKKHHPSNLKPLTYGKK